MSLKSRIRYRKGYLAMFLGALMALAMLAGVASFAGDAPAAAAAQDVLPATVMGPDQAAPAGASAQLQKYMIPRTVPGAGSLTTAQLKDISAASNEVIRQMQAEGKTLYWLESYVGANTITCVYLAASTDLLYEHAKRGSFPIDSVIEVARMIEPATGH